MTSIYRWVELTRELLDQDIFRLQLLAQAFSEERFTLQEPEEAEPAPEPVGDLNELD